jgi:hypothetical protein
VEISREKEFYTKKKDKQGVFMNKTQYLSLLLAAIISGLTGGAGFSWFFSEQKVSAQSNSPTVITAQEFRLVDKDGNLRAALSDNSTFSNGETPSLVLYDRNKKSRLAVGSFKTSVPTIEFFDKNEMSAIVLAQDDDQSIFVLKHNSIKQIGGGVEKKSSAALWLRQGGKRGANVVILDEELNLVWSARKIKGDLFDWIVGR